MAGLLSTLFGMGAVALACTLTSGPYEGEQRSIIVDLEGGEVSVEHYPEANVTREGEHTVAFAGERHHGWINRITGAAMVKDPTGIIEYYTCKTVEPQF